MSSLIENLKINLRGSQLALLEGAAVAAETDACSSVVSNLLREGKFTTADIDKAAEEVGAKLTDTLTNLSFILDEAKKCIVEKVPGNG